MLTFFGQSGYIKFKSGLPLSKVTYFIIACGLLKFL